MFLTWLRGRALSLSLSLSLAVVFGLVHPIMLRVAKCVSSSFPFFGHNGELITPRSKIGFIVVNNVDSLYTNVKKAKLFARKKDKIKLPDFDDGGGNRRMYHISEFLRHPSGVEAMLNTGALQSFQLIDNNLYRCTLPKVQLLNFEVAPVLNLRVTPTDEDCMVELLSCKFEGSNVIERQNDHFSASMTNRITWDNNSEPYLNVDIKLNLNLEIYTRPFTMLPIAAVEGPGNVMMQTLLDRLVPLLLQQLLQDYDKWVQQQS